MGVEERWGIVDGWVDSMEVVEGCIMDVVEGWVS